MLPASLHRSPGVRWSPSGDARSHVRQEFSSLEAWLSAPSTLQLPLHQIERQQQTKGREVQRLLLQAHLQRRGHGDVGPAWCVKQGSHEVLYTSPARHPLSQDRLRTDPKLSAWVTPTLAPTASILSMGPRVTGACILLRVSKAFGPGSRAGHLPGIH